MKSRYVVTKCEKSFCPECRARVNLLMDEEGLPGPSFYLCKECGHVAQVGIGPVGKMR